MYTGLSDNIWVEMVKGNLTLIGPLYGNLNGFSILQNLDHFHSTFNSKDQNINFCDLMSLTVTKLFSGYVSIVSQK